MLTSIDSDLHVVHSRRCWPTFISAVYVHFDLGDVDKQSGDDGHSDLDKKIRDVNFVLNT